MAFLSGLRTPNALLMSVLAGGALAPQDPRALADAQRRFRFNPQASGLPAPRYTAPRPAMTRAEVQRNIHNRMAGPSGRGNVSPHRDTLGERLGNLIASGGEAIGHPYPERLRSEAVNMPFVGDALTALNGATDINRGNYASGAGQIGLAAIGLTPGFGDAAATGLRRLYHGGRPGISEFEPAFAGRSAGTPQERATWFTPDPDDAAHYAAVANANDGEMIGQKTPSSLWARSSTYSGATIYPVDVDTSGFLRISPSDSPHQARRSGYANHPLNHQYYDSQFFGATIERARREGYRGVIFENVSERGGQVADQVAVFD